MAQHPGTMKVARRELLRIGGRPLYLLLLAVLPLASFALLWTIFSAGVVRDLPVAVVDLDNTPLSRQLARMLDASPSIAVTHRASSGLQAERLLLEGKVYAVLLIPHHTERTVLRGSQASVTLYRNSQLLMPSSVIRRDALAVVGTLSARLEMRQRMARGESPAAAAERLEPIRTQNHTLFNPWLNYIYFLASSTLPALLQIFILVATVHAVGVELKDGSGGQWLADAGGSVTRALVGKLLPYTACYLLVTTFMLTLILKLMGVPLHGDLATLVAGTVLFILACQSLGVALVAGLSNLRLATSAAAFIATPAFAFSGLTFPTQAMPIQAKLWSSFLPLTHYLRVLVDQMMRGAPPTASLPALGLLLAFVLLLPALGLSRLPRVLNDERYWGRR